MSLLGRLEDLSLTDIIQIVFLSRRTGVLEIVDAAGRHTVVFRGGLIVNASSPEHPDLLAYLVQRGSVASDLVATLRQMEDNGIPPGTSVVEMQLMTPDDLAAAIRSRIVDVVTPLLQSREGEFNFILSESMDALDIEYDPGSVFKEGGVAPQKILGAADGEKIKPLRGLEESLKAGKALLRSGTPSPEPPTLTLGLGGQAARIPAFQPPVEAPPPVAAPEVSPSPQDPALEDPLAAGEEPPFDTAPPDVDNVLPFPGAGEPFGELAEEPLSELPEEIAAEVDSGRTPLAGQEDPGWAPATGQVFSEAPAVPDERPAEGKPAEEKPAEPRRDVGRFKVAGGLFDIETPDAQYRNVVLFERNPLVRVAAKRAFTKRNVKIFQYGSLDDVRTAMTELFQSNSFFVTFLEWTGDDASLRLVQQLKRRNPRLPVVIVDAEADLRRRHDLLRAGADLYLTKPSPARLQPGLAEEELALFADELVLFSERAFTQWLQVTGGLGPEAGRKFYEQASKDSMDRSFSVLKQLINELSNPNDIDQVASTILRLSAEYLDRGALFVVREDAFEGLGGFAAGPNGPAVHERVRSLRIAREGSVLSDVASGGEAHRGKMKKTPANVALIEGLGGALPTEVLVLPITHGGRTIGILYGDNAEHRTPIDSVTGLEIFLSQAGYAFGNAVFAAEKKGN